MHHAAKTISICPEDVHAIAECFPDMQYNREAKRLSERKLLRKHTALRFARCEIVMVIKPNLTKRFGFGVSECRRNLIQVPVWRFGGIMRMYAVCTVNPRVGLCQRKRFGKIPKRAGNVERKREAVMRKGGEQCIAIHIKAFVRQVRVRVKVHHCGFSRAWLRQGWRCQS